jgi:hypothetical protein
VRAAHHCHRGTAGTAGRVPPTWFDF